MPYKRVHTTETTALTSSWNKTTGNRVSVSKVYITSFLWCCSQTEGYSDFVQVPRSHKQLDTLALTGGLRMRDQLVA